MTILEGMAVTFQKLTAAQRERAKARKADARRRFLERVKAEAEQTAFLYVAFADGSLKEAEYEFLEERLGESTSFSVPSRETLGRTLRAYLSTYSPTLTERQRLKRELATFATCDGSLSPDEEDAIFLIADLLGISAEKRAAQRRAWRKPTAEEQKKKGSDSAKRANTKKVTAPAPALHWSYEYLGCSADDSDETIKKMYRRLAVKLHPDKHAAKMKTPEDALPYIRAFQKLQAAYDEVWKLRGLDSKKRS
jgi:DnaJ-domain-containing protein 1